MAQLEVQRDQLQHCLQDAGSGVILCPVRSLHTCRPSMHDCRARLDATLQRMAQLEVQRDQLQRCLQDAGSGVSLCLFSGCGKHAWLQSTLWKPPGSAWPSWRCNGTSCSAPCRTLAQVCGSCQLVAHSCASMHCCLLTLTTPEEDARQRMAQLEMQRDQPAGCRLRCLARMTC